MFEQLVEYNNKMKLECEQLQVVHRNLEIKLRVSESEKLSLRSEITNLEQSVLATQEMLKMTSQQYLSQLEIVTQMRTAI